MALTVEQLNQAKSLLDGGKNLMQIKQDMTLEITPQELRNDLFDQFGKIEVTDALKTIRQNMRTATPNFSQLQNVIKNRIANKEDLTVAEVDVMINNLNTAITELIIIKSDIDVTP